jgi:acylphosphatase
MTKQRAHVTFTGRVQGVFFRAFTEEVANSLGLNGWVRYTPEGSVEAVFEGEKSDIEKAISDCRNGPPASRVDDVDVLWEDCRDEFGSFRVRYF